MLYERRGSGERKYYLVWSEYLIGWRRENKEKIKIIYYYTFIEDEGKKIYISWD